MARGQLRVAGVPEQELKNLVHALVQEVESRIESYPTFAAAVVLAGVLHDLEDFRERLAQRATLEHCGHGFVVNECVPCFVAELDVATEIECLAITGGAVLPAEPG